MRKFTYLITFLLILGLFCGCFAGKSNMTKNMESKLENNAAYPVYNSLEEKEKELYLNVCSAIENYNEFATVTYDTKAECEAAIKKFESIYRTLMYEQPQYFWVDPYNCTLMMRENGKEFQLQVGIKYILSKDDVDPYKEVFDNKVKEIVDEANKKSGTFEKLLFVYDTILDNTSYDHELAESENFKNLGINAYGCLINGKTICSGYTLAFNLILKELGFECGAEFNTYDSSLSIFGAHVWNYCKLDGEYYYFDLTYDDTGFDSENYKDYLDHSYHYFGITKEELSKSQTLSNQAETPECNGKKYNYYVYKGLNLTEYNYEKMKDALLKQKGNKHVTLRFDEYRELLKAETALLNDGELFNILEIQGEIKYAKSQSGYYLDFFLD